MNLKALIWKWGQGCCSAHIDDNTGEIIIDEWFGPGNPPSPAQIQKAIKDYEEYLTEQEVEKQQKIADLKVKLGLTDEEFEIIRNG